MNAAAVDGWLIVRPAPEYHVTEGDDVVLECSTNSSDPIHPVDWWKMDPSNIIKIYTIRSVSKLFAPRFSVATDDVKADEYNLKIENVSKSDAGRYRCYDDGGYGPDKAETILNVSSQYF